MTDVREPGGSDPGNGDTFVAFSIILGILCAGATFVLLAFQGIGPRFSVGQTALEALVPGLLLAGSVKCGFAASGRRRPRFLTILLFSVAGSIVFFIGLGAAAQARYERQSGMESPSPLQAHLKASPGSLAGDGGVGQLTRS